MGALRLTYKENYRPLKVMRGNFYLQKNSDAERYEFGFNGQLKDNEIYGEGNAYAFEYRIQDPRLVRFLSVDPLRKDYPFYSPYQFAGNQTIVFVDIEGLEAGDKGVPDIKPVFNVATQQMVQYQTAISSTFVNSADQRGAYEPQQNIAVGQLPKSIPAFDIHMFLDIVGAVPLIGEVADIANGIAYTFEGDWSNAGISYMAVIPIVGEGGKVLRYGIKYNDEARDVVKAAEKLDDVKKTKNSNKLKPDEKASGDHSSFTRDKDGNIYKYETYEKTSTGHNNPVKRFDGGKPDGTQGAPHINKSTQESISTPHIQGKNIPGGARKPEPSELPNNKRFNNE